MPAKNKLILLLFLLLAIACGDDGYGGGSSRSSPPPETEETIEPVDFSTRLNNQLLIAGENCSGGETTEVNGERVICSSNQWLITIDDVNTCSASGACTEVGIFPIIGEVQEIDINDPIFRFFAIIPRSEITIQQQNILNDVQVRSDLSGGNAVVIFK